ncbi:MAG: hypothetical protein J6V44_05900 [Methanobrevibacter sp.]|nr:hypothetical protein [Methanobrevibacter sp.]MBO7692784.1 hypothetical protein [Methanobrevibacter sp.]
MQYYKTEYSNVLERFDMMEELRNKLSHELNLLKLQKLQNDILYINAKRKLYGKNVFGIMNMDEMCHKASKYLTMLKNKEIRKNAKCEERSFYDVLVASIQNGTGIKVKSIDTIIFYNYDSVFEIDLTDAEYNLNLRISIPNIKNPKFFPTISDTLKEEDVREILYELDLRLSYIKEKTQYSTSLETIVSYPTARDTNGYIEDPEKFKEYLNQFASGLKSNR